MAPNAALRTRGSFQSLPTTQTQIEAGRVEKEAYLQRVVEQMSDNGRPEFGWISGVDAWQAYVGRFVVDKMPGLNRAWIIIHT